MHKQLAIATLALASMASADEHDGAVNTLWVKYESAGDLNIDLTAGDHAGLKLDHKALNLKPKDGQRRGKCFW